MGRKYRGLRRYGFGMFSAFYLSALSVIVGQPDYMVRVLNIDLEV